MTADSDTLRWRQLDARHHLHPFTDHAALAARGSWVVTRAEGCWLWDSEGNRFLDGMAGMWCVNVGYGRAELAAAAQRQMAELPYYNTFFQSTTPATVNLAARLAELSPGLGRVFFTNSGSEASDTAVKLVRYFWNLSGRPDKKILISRGYGYHGTTLAAASLSGMAAMHPQADLPLAGFEHVDAPYWYADGGDLTPEAYGRLVARQLEQRIEQLGADKVAAFIGEPVQGAGGVIIPPAGYWQEIERICRRHDVLLIADEVICGFGRTGHWWGCERFGFTPDIITAAKGLSSGYQPIAAVLVGPRVGDALVAEGREWAHGFTCSGHPVAAAVALENLRILTDEGLFERASGPLGEHFAHALASLADHPLVGEVRICGLLAAIELVEDPASRRRFAPERRVGAICRDHCLAGGLIMRPVRDTMVLSPPLVISEDEIDQIVLRAGRALERTAADLAL